MEYGKNINWVEKDLKYIWHPCSQMKDYETLKPIVIEKGKGVYLYDVDGNRYIDVISSWWCNLLGHCNPRISNAIKEQADTLEHVIFANFSHKKVIELCDRLSKLVPKGLCKFNFADNGSSAIEMAMKMSFQYHQQTGNPQKTKFMALTDAYHGETIGALSVGAVDLYSEIYKPILMNTIKVPAPDCYRCPYGKLHGHCNCECFERVEKVFEQQADEACAMLVEPLLQGSAGMKVYPPIFLTKLRKLCDKYNVHLVADEIATGFGRTGKMFAFEHAGVSPDIMCVSKGLTGGYMPMAIAITTQKIYDAFYADYATGKAFMHSHTYSGNPLAAAAAVEVLNILEDGSVLKRANENAIYFTNLIKQTFAAHKNVGDIRHIGLVNAIEIVKDKVNKKSFDSSKRLGYQIYKKALKRGVLLRPLGDIIYFNPPLIFEREDMNYSVKVAYECMQEVLK